MPHSPTSTRTRLVACLLIALAAPVANGQGADPARKVPEALNFANGLYRARRYDLAAEEYEKFLKAGRPIAEVDAADARFGLGNARLFLGQYREARLAFEEFVQAAPDHPNAPTGRYRVGETAYILGDLPAARHALEAYVDRDGGDRRYLQAAWSHLGDVDFRLGDLPAARKAYEAALAGNPKGSLASRARLGLGRALAAQGEAEEALKALRELIAQGGAEWSDKAALEVGKVEANRGRWREAADALEGLEKATPRSPLVAEARLARAEALGKLDRPEEAEALLALVADDPSQPLAPRAADALGSSLLARARPAEALAALDRAVDRLGATASAPALRYRAAEAAVALGKLNDARARFLKIATDDPKAPSADDALLRAAAMTLDARDWPTARKLAALFASKFPESPLRADARLIDARAALALGQSREAIATLERSLAEDQPAPATAQAAQYYLGLAYQKDGQPEKSAEALARLSGASAPLAADARYLLGQTEFDAGRYEQALPPLEKYLADKPQGEVADHALARIAQAQSALDRPAEAAASLARLAEGFPTSPTLPPTRLRLAEAALLAKDYGRAADLFRSAAEAPDPATQARARSGLGWALLRGEKPAEAAAAFASLLEASPDDPLAPEAALARGFALDRAGQAPAAASAYASALEKYPKAPQAGPAALALARLRLDAKKYDEAAASYALIAKEYPTTAGEPLDAVLAEWGGALVEAGKAAEADAPFGRILKEFPEGPKAADARYNLAASAFAARDFARVQDLLGPVVAAGASARPALAGPALLLLGRAQAERQDWPGASATFDRLVAEEPEGPLRREGRFWKAEVAFKSGDAAKAEPEFAALASGPPQADDFPALVPTAGGRRVQCLAQLGRWDETLAAAEALPPSGPLGPEVDYSRGRAFQGLARFDEARAAFDRVIEARAGTELAARAQLMRGEASFHEQKYKEALRDYYRVILQYDAPEWQAVALLEAGKVHEKLGQWREAAESYETLRTRFPKDRNAEEAGKRLDLARAKRAESRPG